MTIRLYDFAGSPFCIKIRAILDHKRLSYDRMSIVSTKFLELRRRSATNKVPALELDGRFISDSTEIAYALDEHQPEPPLVPADPRLAADNHVLEDWADEALYFIGLYYRWQEPEGRRGAAEIFPGAVAPVLGAAVGSTARRQLRAQGTGRKSPEQVALELDRSLESLVARLRGRDFLLGEQPYLCDFSVMGQLVYLARTPAGARALGARAPLTDYLDRMRSLRAAPPT